MHPYRTHSCGALRASDLGQQVRLSGWVDRKRDHGGLVFIDLRDHEGLTQCVAEETHRWADGTLIADVLNQDCRIESAITVTGEVVERAPETHNKEIPTGTIEVRITDITVHNTSEVLPFPLHGEDNANDELRLRYRFLDLRRARLQQHLKMRHDVIAQIRAGMIGQGFKEIHTPILTASSPEGARDFLVPSRLHPGKFYALPQAPQQFKQLLMASGVDRYFQIAPCFRDEDARADRSPGEFYQLDMEMSFVEQDEILTVIETVLGETFKTFGRIPSTTAPFPRISYREALARFGTDKPDLRNPLELADVSEVFTQPDVTFRAFSGAVASGSVVLAVSTPQVGKKPRSFFDNLNRWAQDMGAPGLGYVIFEGEVGKGPIAKFIGAQATAMLRERTGARDGDAVFFVCAPLAQAQQLGGLARDEIARRAALIDTSRFALCWIVDFPMFELDKDGKIDFSHNPFSMPQGGMQALESQAPLEVLAYQYDLVCDGIEIASGAIRNHRTDILYKAFEIAGHARRVVDERFASMVRAFSYGAPPHGGCAPGIERILMLLADTPNIREVIPFPLSQRGEDILMGAPSAVNPQQLKDVWVKLDLPPSAPDKPDKPA
ncbi:MAG: aspartate--tRNA ligase [Pseudomonadota bacterium]